MEPTYPFNSSRKTHTGTVLEPRNNGWSHPENTCLQWGICEGAQTWNFSPYLLGKTLHFFFKTGKFWSEILIKCLVLFRKWFTKDGRSHPRNRALSKDWARGVPFNPFSHNHGSGKLPQMKGNYCWRETFFHFHDYGRKGQGKSWLKWRFYGCLVNSIDLYYIHPIEDLTTRFLSWRRRQLFQATLVWFCLNSEPCHMLTDFAEFSLKKSIFFRIFEALRVIWIIFVEVSTKKGFWKVYF